LEEGSVNFYKFMSCVKKYRRLAARAEGGDLLSKRRRRNEKEKEKRQSKWMCKKQDPDQVKGLIRYKNLFDKPDPTPYEANRLRYFDKSILTE